jgi:hypothetical protein
MIEDLCGGDPTKYDWVKHNRDILDWYYQQCRNKYKNYIQQELSKRQKGK